MSEAIPAATVVIFRNGPPGQAPELLMTIRSRTMAFAGGMAVFPGGKVDQSDHDLASRIANKTDTRADAEEIAHRIAVIRETLEETGLAIGLVGNVDAAIARNARKLLLEKGSLAPVLDHFGWTLDLDQITPFARWNPRNERIPRVYDTRFYLADLGTGAVDIEADLSENTRLFWISAKDALDAAARDEIKVIFPTRRNLERLACFSSYQEAKVQAEAIPVRTITPHLEVREGQTWLCIGEDLGYPVTSEPMETVTRG